METSSGHDPVDDEMIERPAHLGQRLVTGGTVHDQLGDHRVVVGGDFASALDGRVPANIVGNLYLVDGADLGSEPVTGVFGHDPDLDGMALKAQVFGVQGQPFTGRNSNHELHQIYTGDRFGHRVFDL